MIGIIVAMPKELAGYLKLLGDIKKEVIADKEFFIGSLGAKRAVVCLSGIGKVNATIATAIMAIKYNPSLIINTGIAGGLGTLSTLDIVIADKVCQHDMDTSPLGDPVGYISGVDKIYFDTDKAAQEAFLSVAPNAILGTIASGDQFIADTEKAQNIVDIFGAIGCDMEGGAVGQTAYLFGIPFISVRCISDYADERASMSFEELAQQASNASVAIVTQAIQLL